MSLSGANMAVTEDGAVYNKLRRPDDYLASLKAPPPPRSELPPKRKLETVGAGNHGEPAAKRTKENSSIKAGASSKRSLAADTRRVFRPIKENGMQTMFPGLDGDDNDSSDETTKDALAYLRSVRSEASSIPALLVAPIEASKNGRRDRSMNTHDAEDHRVVYQDGMWIAMDYEDTGEYHDEDDDEWSQYSDDINPQDAYYKSLLSRYKALCSTFSNANLEELEALKKSDPQKYACAKLPFSKSEWRFTFDNKIPTPASIAQFNDRMLYRAMEYAAEVLITGDTISKQKSCWIWTLLALAGDPGTLDYYKVGRIRELGHKAAQLRMRLDGQRQNQCEDDEEVEGWDVDGTDTDGEDENDSGNGVMMPEAMHGAEAQQQVENESTGDKNTDVSLRRASERDKNEVSSSEDEGEVHEDGPNEDGSNKLEVARARLLAQLGNNLVATSIPDPQIPPYQLRANQQGRTEGLPGTRHRHNGKLCKDPSCRKKKVLLGAHRKAEMRVAQGKVVNGSASGAPQKSPQVSQAIQPEADGKRSEIGAEKVPETANDGSLAYGEPLAEQLSASHSSSDSDSPAESIDLILNTRVTIDMILTVVGECYGQRDLLQFREAW